jgi:hypothetical protein
MQRRFARAFPATLALATLAGCAGELINQPSGFEGDVTGLITAADMTTPIPGVTVAPWGFTGPTAVTNQQGRYVITGLPIGPRTLLATRGHFAGKVPIDVLGNVLTEQPPGVLLPSGKLAYIPGSFDSIEKVVRDRLRNPIDQIAVADLANPAVTSEYAMIFLNCGLDASRASDPATIANLRAYIDAGGIIYASDYAMSYAQALFPADFISVAANGDTQTASAQVTNPDLLAFVGKPDAQIYYKLGAWYTLQQLSANAQILLTGTYTAGGVTESGRPLAVVINSGAGRLVYTTFHNNDAVTDDQLKVLYYFIYID